MTTIERNGLEAEQGELEDDQIGDSMALVSMKLVGESPLLMHNERLANPADPLVKEISAFTSKGSKRQTDDDRAAVLRLEWEGGLYWAPGVGPYIPGANLKKSLMEAGKMFRAGTALKRALLPMDAVIPLEYAGPRELEAMWAAGLSDTRLVKNPGSGGKVMRCRPCFPVGWTLETRFLVNLTLVDIQALKRYLWVAGQTTGLGDYRPTFGRFTGRIGDVLSGEELLHAADQQ